MSEAEPVTVTATTDPSTLTTEIRDTLNNSWNWHDDASEDLINGVTANTFEAVIVESWYAAKKLDGLSIFYADKEAETEDAILYSNLIDTDDFHHEKQANFQTRVSKAWVPKSVIQTQVVRSEG